MGPVQSAVYQACDELGVRTSLRELWHQSCIIAGKPLNRLTVGVYRNAYKKAKKIKNVDCRTYRGQPRRNMLNDGMATLGQVKRIKHVLGLKRVLPESILNLLGDGKDQFHSIEQLRNAVSELIELRKVA